MYLRAARTYVIMEESDVQELVLSLSKVMPRFEDGRINYVGADLVPFVMVFVRHEAQILLLRRSLAVETYKGKWSVVTGFLDEPVPIANKALAEVREELGVSGADILSLVIGKPYIQTDPDINGMWVSCPVTVTLRRKPEIRLDFEHTEYRWVLPEEVKMFETTPRLYDALMRSLPR